MPRSACSPVTACVAPRSMRSRWRPATQPAPSTRTSRARRTCSSPWWRSASTRGWRSVYEAMEAELAAGVAPLEAARRFVSTLRGERDSFLLLIDFWGQAVRDPTAAERFAAAPLAPSSHCRTPARRRRPRTRNRSRAPDRPARHHPNRARQRLRDRTAGRPRRRSRRPLRPRDRRARARLPRPSMTGGLRRGVPSERPYAGRCCSR